MATQRIYSRAAGQLGPAGRDRRRRAVALGSTAAIVVGVIAAWLIASHHLAPNVERSLSSAFPAVTTVDIPAQDHDGWEFISHAQSLDDALFSLRSAAASHGWSVNVIEQTDTHATALVGDRSTPVVVALIADDLPSGAHQVLVRGERR